MTRILGLYRNTGVIINLELSTPGIKRAVSLSWFMWMTLANSCVSKSGAHLRDGCFNLAVRMELCFLLSCTSAMPSQNQAFEFYGCRRRRLALKAKSLGRNMLRKYATLVHPDTLLRWYKKLIAEKYDGSKNRGSSEHVSVRAPQRGQHSRWSTLRVSDPIHCF